MTLGSEASHLQRAQTRDFLRGFSTVSSPSALRGEDAEHLRRLCLAIAVDPQNDVSGAIIRWAAGLAREHDWAEEGETSVATLRGATTGAARICLDETGEPTLTIEEERGAYLERIVDFLGTPPTTTSEGRVAYRGVAALDVLSRIVEDETLALPSHRRAFQEWSTRISHIGLRREDDAELRVQLLRPDARLPSKERTSDSGYDLTLLYEKKRIGPTTLYGTGIIVEPPQGWYLDVVPRSSIIKRGYLLANNVGVIDRSYRGEIFVPLLKIDPAAPDLELPARVAQLIPRPIVHFPIRQYESLIRTSRGTGGFGSTGG